MCLNISTYVFAEMSYFQIKERGESAALDEHRKEPSTLAEINVN